MENQALGDTSGAAGQFGVEHRTDTTAVTTQAPAWAPASCESGFFSALVLRRWLTRVAVDRDSSRDHESAAGNRPARVRRPSWVSVNERVAHGNKRQLRLRLFK